MNDIEKLQHPYYKLMELRGENLQMVLNSWSRENLIKWLSWNDKNGVYRDSQSLAEFGNILTKQEAIKIITEQILQTS